MTRPDGDDPLRIRYPATGAPPAGRVAAAADRLAIDAVPPAELPTGEGYDCLVCTDVAALRAVRRSGGPPVVVLAADECAADRAFEAGAADVVRTDAPGDRVVALATRVERAAERGRERRALGRSVERFRTLVEQSHDAVCVYRDERFEYVNERACRLTGYDREELVGEPIWRLVHPDDRERLRDIAGRRVAEGDAAAPATYEARVVTRDGEVRECELGVQSVVEGGDRAVLVSVHDVTELKRRERELRDRTDKIEALHRVATDIGGCTTDGEVCDLVVDAAERVLSFDICVIDVEEDGALVTRATSSNTADDGYYEATPVEAGDNLGAEAFRTGSSSVVDDLAASAANPANQAYRSALTVPIGEHGVFQAVAKEPSFFDAADRELAVLLASHAEQALDRIARERALRERKRDLTRYETIVETAPDGVFVLDEDGRVVGGNDTAAAMIGCGREELLGRSVERLIDEGAIDEAHRDPYEESVRALLADGSPSKAKYEVETSVDGADRTFEVHLALLDEDDEFGGTVGVLRDVTERNARKRELARQNERLEEFASVVSHDLRSPLNVATGYLSLAREGESTNPDHLATVAGALDRMDELIEDVLAFARTGQSVRNPEAVSLAGAAREAWRTAGDAAASLVTRGDLGAIRCEESRLRQLFENLFRNAVEHAGPGATVRVGTLPGGFYVEDDGPGIPPDERDAVFASGVSSTAAGTGFGLAIVQQIADAHGWTVDVVEGSDGGARFEVTGVDPADETRDGGDGADDGTGDGDAAAGLAPTARELRDGIVRFRE